MTRTDQPSLLVTGAAGFLGRHVSRVAAQRGYHVTGMGHGGWSTSRPADWGISDWHESDVTTRTLAHLRQRPDVIVHCAGSGSAALAMQEPARDFTRSVVSTVDVLEFMRAISPQTVLIYPSSGAVYGTPWKVPVSEGDPATPANPYGVHKRAAETMIESYARHFDLRAGIVRIFSLYGTALRKQLLWDACVKAMNGTVTFGGTGTETRDWVSVEDTVDLLLLTASNAATSPPIVNCATGIEVSISEVLTHLFAALGVSESPVFAGVRRQGDLVRYAGDPARAHAWGWNPQQSWQEGVADYARWFLESEWNGP